MDSIDWIKVRFNVLNIESWMELPKVERKRKRKRMESNRESARRCRMRKQKRVDDLMAEMGELQKENSEMVGIIKLTREQYLNVEAHNSVLRAQIVELTHSLQSLNHIINTTQPLTFFYPDNYPLS
ncbi:bZIP transcription factor 11-like [Senna tora]|uniref:BZIP transcription factor 11-like n=1 Tax=Senna tora TaxID=362788 RepID=A0A834WBV9_9FABA|nr:bZIP transcription factor 11-like [Senna tora]